MPARRVWRGIARTFQITEVFPELTVRENLRIAVEVASGYRLRMWQSEDADVDVKERVVELLEMSGLSRQAPTGWSASSPTAISAPPRS